MFGSPPRWPGPRTSDFLSLFYFVALKLKSNWRRWHKKKEWPSAVSHLELDPVPVRILESNAQRYRHSQHSRTMAFGTNLVWRYPLPASVAVSCQGISLDNGFVLINPLDTPNLRVLQNQLYFPTCYNSVPLLSTFKEIGAQTLPVVTEDWLSFVGTEFGSFKYSVYPIIYSLTVSTVIAIFLTIIVFTNHTQKPSWLLRLSSFLGSFNLMVLFVRAIIFLNRQHVLGISSGEKLLDDLQSDQVFNSIDFIFVLIAQFAEVQVIIRLFSRAKEKRVSFIVGGAVSLASQVIWAVSTFSVINLDDEESDLSILPAFTYLLRIALSTVYSGLIFIYAIGKRNYIFQRRVLFLSVLTFLVINLQVAFFIADISNIWVSELSEIFNTTIYIGVTVIPWEWINRVHSIERHEQKEGVLGRPFYEDEYKDIIRYEIVDDDFEDQFDNGGNNTNNNIVPFDNSDPNQRPATGENGESFHESPRIYTPFKKIKNTISSTTNALLYVTDQVIAYGLAVPRSVSTDSATIQQSHQQKKSNAVNNMLPGAKKEVFVYSKKEVVCDSDTEDRTNEASSGLSHDYDGIFDKMSDLQNEHHRD